MLKKGLMFLAALGLVASIFTSLAIVLDGGADGSGEGNGLLTFPLLRPAFAASSAAAGTFPADPDAGLTAYVRVPPEQMDLDKLMGGLFSDVKAVGDNYLIGNVRLRGSWLSSLDLRRPSSTLTLNVPVYADTDGLLIAYVPRSSDNSEVLVKGCRADGPGGEVTPVLLGPAPHITFLECALGAAVKILDSTRPAIKWYHWGIQDASHLMIGVFRHSLTFPSGLCCPSKNLYVALPPNATWKDISMKWEWLVDDLRDNRGFVASVQFDGEVLFARTVTAQASFVESVPWPRPLPSVTGVPHTFTVGADRLAFRSQEMEFGIIFFYKLP